MLIKSTKGIRIISCCGSRLGVNGDIKDCHERNAKSNGEGIECLWIGWYIAGNGVKFQPGVISKRHKQTTQKAPFILRNAHQFAGRALSN